MFRRIGAVAILFGMLSLPGPALAQQVKEARPGLLARASITPDSARSAALGAVSGGAILEGELEEERGLLVYSFDLKVQGTMGVEEVQVDAKTGRVVCSQHESDAAERAEHDRRKPDSTLAKGKETTACGS